MKIKLCSLLQFTSLPWSDILSSSAVWAIVFGHFGACWGYYTLFTGMPTYFKDVLDFDIEQVDLKIIKCIVVSAVHVPEDFKEFYPSQHLRS